MKNIRNHFRVWIELDLHPTDHALNRRRCDALNKFMEKVTGCPKTFDYSDLRNEYEVNMGGGVWQPLEGDGYWFDLGALSE